MTSPVPPNELVSSFNFVTSSTLGGSIKSPSESGRDVDAEMKAGIRLWEGRTVFSTTTSVALNCLGV